jgi:hypothetical protein
LNALCQNWTKLCVVNENHAAIHPVGGAPELSGTRRPAIRFFGGLPWFLRRFAG